METIPDRFEEQVFFTTVRIVAQQPGRPDHSVGTGFLYRVRLKASESEVILLVSNKHVFQNPSGALSLTMTKRKPNTDQPWIGQTRLFSFTTFQNNYFPHPDPQVDLACMNVSQYADEALGLHLRTIGESMCCQFTEEDLRPGLEAWFIGYPDGRFDVVNNLPLLRRGYVSSMPKVDYDGKQQFVIDAPVYPGSSGSPVFSVLGGHFTLLGIVSQTMVKHGRLTTMPTADQALGVQQVLGLGLVIKSTALTSLVHAASEGILALQRRRASDASTVTA